MRLTVTFPKSDRRAPAVYEWPDGLAATCPPTTIPSGETRADFVEARERSLALRAAWESVPMGGASVVSWPLDTAARIVQAYDPDAVAAPKTHRRSKGRSIRA